MISSLAAIPLVIELPSSRPLLPLEFAMIFLDTDQAGVLERMEEGIISHAWDIGRGTAKRELRFYWKSLAAAKAAARTGTRPVEIPDHHVYADVIPATWTKPRAALLYRRWTCSPHLICDLLAARELQPLTSTQRGNSGSPEIPRDSILQFLHRRRCS